MDRDGVYRVTYEQLREAGCDLVGVPAARIGVRSRGVQVPVYVAGDAAFGSESFIELLGEALDSPYTRENVYRLTVEDSPARVVVDGRRPPEASALAAVVVATRNLETRRAYSFSSPTGDPWFDTRMQIGAAPGEWSFDFVLENLGGDGAGELSVELFGGLDLPAAPDHHVEALLDGVRLADVRFDGLTAQRLTIPVPAGGLKRTGNRLTLRLPADLGTPFDVVHLQGYAATYPRELRAVGDSATFTGAAPGFAVPGFTSGEVVAYREIGGHLERLAGTRTRRRGGGWAAEVPGGEGEARYVLAAAPAVAVPRLLAARRGLRIAGPAQYLVISHPDFVDGLAPLLAARAAQGLSFALVDARDVYAAYSFSIVDPEAIRAFIADAAAALAVEYVLLVGGDTYDYLGYTGSGARSFIPSLYAPTDDVVRFAPVDPALADVDRDGVPDLAIGRFPVRSREELATVIAKTLAFERAGTGREAVLVADRKRPGEAPWYLRLSEDVASRLGEGWRRERLYLDEMPAATARELLRAAVRSGVPLVTFTGHSAPSTWTQDPVLALADVGTLSNSERPSVVVQWACWNTYYVSPASDSLGVALLLSPCGGAAAVLGTTSLASDAAQRTVAGHFAARLAAPGVRLGAAVLAAKRALARDRPGAVSVQYGWTLLGDPALIMPQ